MQPHVAVQRRNVLKASMAKLALYGFRLPETSVNDTSVTSTAESERVSNGGIECPVHTIY